MQRRQPSHRYRLCAKIHTSIYALQKNKNKNNPTRHNFAEIISRVAQLRPSALCERQEGANDLLPLISNLPTPEPGVHSQRTCVSNGPLVNLRARPSRQINKSSVITQGADCNYLTPISLSKRSWLCDEAKRNTTASQACARREKSRPATSLNIVRIYSITARVNTRLLLSGEMQDALPANDGD